MFDALCHLDFMPFDLDRKEVLARGRMAGVKGWMVAGVRPSDWDKQASLLVHPDVFVAYGIHPHVAAHWSQAELDDGMEQLQTRRGLAVGEIGLDSSKYVPRGK